MSTGYAIAYRLGITPWERAGDAGAAQLSALFDAAGPARGRALDVGCGRGAHAIELARRGWEVTGVDLIPRALTAARARARDAGQDVSFVQGDVTDLPPEVGTGHRLVLDLGCFHGLDAQARRRMGEQINAVTAPDATMILLAFAPGGRGPLPRGADRADVLAAFTGWSVVDEQPAETAGMPAPLRRRAPCFYRLTRD